MHLSGMFHLTDSHFIGILKSIKERAPTVKRVVITSSFASIIDGDKGANIPDKTYSEADWNPITEEQATKNPTYGYRGKSPFRVDCRHADKKTQRVKRSLKRQHGNSKRMKDQTSLSQQCVHH
jgi:hypothetical protein